MTLYRAWICEACATTLKLEWRKYAACSYGAGACGFCKAHMPKGTRREYHEIAIGDLW